MRPGEAMDTTAPDEMATNIVVSNGQRWPRIVGKIIHQGDGYFERGNGG